MLCVLNPQCLLGLLKRVVCQIAVKHGFQYRSFLFRGRTSAESQRFLIYDFSTPALEHLSHVRDNQKHQVLRD